MVGQVTTPTDRPGAVKRSLITLQALADCETRGIVAVRTTSLPELPGRGRSARCSLLRGASKLKALHHPAALHQSVIGYNGL